MPDQLTHLDRVDGLRRWQEDFEKDFSIRDLRHELEKFVSQNIFREICNMQKEKEKIEKLFFYLIYNKKDVRPFINILRDPYDWIYEKICKSKGDQWISDYKRAIQDIPNNQDWNIHRVEYLWKIQQHLKIMQRGNYLILFGKLGFGKRWLAADACRDFSVIQKMSFKIFWLNVSKCSTQELILEKMHRLKVILNADNSSIKYNTYSGNTKNEIIHMKYYLRKILEQPEYKDCLLVLSNVQDVDIIKAFNLKCKIFITTRHIEKLDWISKDSKTTIDIKQGFTTDESIELFHNAFNGELPGYMEDYIENFHTKTQGHPFIMSQIAKSFQNFEESQNARKTRCENWLKNLEEYKPTGEYFQLSMEESLKFLSDKQRICYDKMVIFADNSEIPLKVLEKIWETDAAETEEIVLKLYKYSLIEYSDMKDIDKSCSLHYLHFHFLENQVSKQTREAYHRLLVEKYEVERIFHERKEFELDFPDDGYFYYYIPYHLEGSKMKHLFKVYLDFGFLEKKMKITKLPNTVGDLIRFKKYIFAGDNCELELDALIDFLTKSEHSIFASDDVNLLQCALASVGNVRKTAEIQSKKFIDRVWMNDYNHAENQTQIVQLACNSQPQLVRFVKPTDNLVCLITLQDNNILLHDISQGYLDTPVLYYSETPKSVIIDLQVFRNNTFLALNDLGKLSAYTLKNSPTRRFGPQKVSTVKSVDSQNNKLLQRLDGGQDKFTCFNVFEHHSDSVNSEIDLIVGTINGNIKFYQWKLNKFEEKRGKMIKSRFSDLFRMAHILDKYVMLLNAQGDLRFINLINSGLIPTNCKWEGLESPLNLHQGICKYKNQPISLCVSTKKVVQIAHELKTPHVNAVVFMQIDEIFVAQNENDDNRILSSTMSSNAEYLVLGTTKGIIVIDRFNKQVVFRRNVSDQVLSLDLYYDPDDALYILSSIFKDAGQIISLYAFNDNRDDLALMNHEMNFLVGDDLFDVKQSHSMDEWKMVAIDAKRNIHYRSSGDDFSQSDDQFPFPYQVKKICWYGERVIVGCTNGSVYITNQMNEINSLTSLLSEITYLQCFEDVIIASCNLSYKIIKLSERETEYDGEVTKAYHYNVNQLLLVKKNCAIEVVDTTNGNIVMTKVLTNDFCSAQAYYDNLVIIGTEMNFVHIWKVNEFDDDEDTRKFEVDKMITALAVSRDKNFLAIGCSNGYIEIIDLIHMTPIKRLESHKRPIMRLRFSPWSSPNDPLILLSVSESIIFWNIRSIVNNQLEMKRKASPGRLRVSQRFKQALKVSTAVDTSSQLLNATENLSLVEKNPWRYKTGPSAKPELLSCIKLVAKSAKRIVHSDDFTRFVTIDNEGNIYHLRMIQENSDSDISIDFNENPIQHYQ